MKRLPAPVALDFAGPARGTPLLGAALAALGILAVVSLGLAFQRSLTERNELDAELGAMAPPRKSAATPESLKAASAAVAIQRELAIPWTRLLAELEAAGHDTAVKVSLLHVEPDPSKHQVRITAEVRTLPDALVYLKRLQKSEVLRFPMLESHEKRKDDPEQPLRIKLLAEWRS
jgi:hypothetical protein